MGLKKYQEKRNFKVSPEPKGNEAKARRTRKGKPLFFCVQKHLASHLHYDLRLEHNGVLMSWAVPKGPSLDPKVKRFAAQVEDHPIEYGTFEGVIPEGYGAGIVMLWDRGTWTPEVDDVDAALRKGDLKMTLNGYKLKGSWVLVRTRGWGGRGAGDEGRSWLLIKHRDEWAGDVDITEFAPASVKGGGDFADILAQDRPEIWESHRPAQSGESGQMFERIVRRALEMRAAAAPAPDGSSSPARRAATRTARGKGAARQPVKKTSATTPRPARKASGRTASKAAVSRSRPGSGKRK